MLTIFFLSLFLAAALVLRGSPARALEAPRPSIILVTAGSVDPNDLKGLMSLEKRVSGAFPCYDVTMAFTSNEVREAWAKRGRDPNFKRHFPWVEERFYAVKNTLTTLALIQETGPRMCLVQPLELVDGSAYHDIYNIVDSLRKIKAFERNDAPFPYIGLGNPAAGLGDGQKENLFRVAGAFKPLFAEAAESGASVVLVTDSLGEANTPVYRSLAEVLEVVFQPNVFIGIPPKLGSKFVLQDMQKIFPPPGNLVLGSLSFFVSDAVREDLFGEGGDSWASAFSSKGYSVIPHQGSLSDSPAYADIFINSLKKMEESVSRRYTE